ncbi:hypothetical protein FOL47_009274 [Perkinsus chesapeaki]|uniref:Uncharacterized protein n=1 Tax=Perkinsus chesapeaki TaxID=330153 RepID=A0A7J6L974_PERCH|nr:hypothetical protein FOL47_009274 [Perkinsus chesapeaki]
MHYFTCIAAIGSLLSWAVTTQADTYPSGPYVHYFDKDHHYALMYGFVLEARVQVAYLNCTNKADAFSSTPFPTYPLPPKPGIKAYKMGMDNETYDAMVEYALTYCGRFGYTKHHTEDFWYMLYDIKGNYMNVTYQGGFLNLSSDMPTL